MRPGSGAERGQGFAGARLGGLIVFFPRRHAETALKLGAGVVLLSVGQIGEAEFQLVLELAGLELDRAPQVRDGLRAGRARQAAVENPGENPGSGAERRDFAMPAAEDMMSPGIVRVEGQGAFRFLPDETRVLDLRLEIAVDGELAMAHGQGKHADRILWIQLDRALGIIEGQARAALLLPVVLHVDDEVGVLPGDFLEDPCIIGPGPIRGDEQLQRAVRIEPALGCDALLEERVSVGGGGQSRCAE